MKISMFLLLMLLPLLTFAQETEWIKTEGTITEISKTGSRKSKKAIATVTYQIENGETITSTAELARIPVLGTWNSVGDVIEINYDKNNPAIVQTNTGKFITQYGMYILIGLGIIFSFNAIRKSMSAQQENTDG